LSNQPIIFEVDTRPHLTAMAPALGREATLEDIPDDWLGYLASLGIQYIWFMGVWQLGLSGKAISQAHSEWQGEFRKALPDLQTEDITGSPYAIASYQVDVCLGGNSALAGLRQRMKKFGLKLCLDFVPNHTGIDHPWVHDHPDYYIHGTSEHLSKFPANYTSVLCHDGPHILAHGRDPYFPGWADTLQLNYFNQEVQSKMLETLLDISDQCDALRCDMSMLVIPEVFSSTWQENHLINNPRPVKNSFWPDATETIKKSHPGFLFIAEAYWDLEWRLQQDGFDFTYDKKLYDRILTCGAKDIHEHLHSDPSFGNKCARFLENHDEPRIASKLEWPKQQCACLITFLTPGMLLLHEGQLEGNKVRSNVHLRRRILEPVSLEILTFSEKMLELIKANQLRESIWTWVQPIEAWAGNFTHQDFITFIRQHPKTGLHIFAINYSGHQSQCLFPVSGQALPDGEVVLTDLLSGSTFKRNGSDLTTNGLFVDLPPWGYHWLHYKPN